MKESATEHFTARRGNCAQSVALAWKDKKQPATDLHNQFSGFGHGRAPDGLCGALYAACEIAGDPKSEALKEQFERKTAGHTACREIRRNRAMPCADCVATAAGLLDELTKET